MSYITLRWTSGRTEGVHAIAHWVRDGVLILEISCHDYRYIPLSSLKEWTAEEG